MKRITALLHAHRLSDIVHALEAVGQRRLSITHAHGLLSASNQREQEFSVELGERMTQEIQLDVFCEDVDAASVIALLKRHGRTGQHVAGWIFVADLTAALPIDGGTE
ncbi:MAG: P-II family nitrogen regulator [Ahniella sp.]|nr:P-II family nitrogen regulator [Ahniella sp.]